MTIKNYFFSQNRIKIGSTNCEITVHKQVHTFFKVNSKYLQVITEIMQYTPYKSDIIIQIHSIIKLTFLPKKCAQLIKIIIVNIVCTYTRAKIDVRCLQTSQKCRITCHTPALSLSLSLLLTVLSDDKTIEAFRKVLFVVRS